VNRLRRLPVLLLALLLASSALLAACSGRSGTALTVNGVTLTNDEFTSWLSAVSSSKVAPTTLIPGTYSTSLTTSLLNQQVIFAVLRSEVERRHLSISEDDLTAAEQQADSDFAPKSIDPTTGQQVAGTASQGKAVLDKLGSFKTAYVRAVADQTALQKDYADKLGSPAVLRRLYDKNPNQFKGRACVTSITVPAATSSDASGATTTTPAAMTQALKTAQQVRSEVNSPTEFEAAAQQIAQQESLTNGGDLGCVPKGTYATQAPALEEAIWSLPVGEISQPIKGTQGYYLIRVRARGDLTFDDVKSELQLSAAQQSVTDFQNWFARALKHADVAVDPQWGSWDAKTGAVVAPVGATSSIGAKPRSTSTTTRSTTTSSR